VSSITAQLPARPAVSSLASVSDALAGAAAGRTQGALTLAERALNDAIVGALGLERRVDPYFRPAFDRALREPLVSAVQTLVNLRRPDEQLGLAEEQRLPGEAELTQQIIDAMGAFMGATYAPGQYQRAGNTKTHGVVRGVFEVLDSLPTKLRKGIFERPRSYPAWVRFAGPGPLSPSDVKDSGILSVAVKLMSVPGRKLVADERFTQDFTAISAPTFTTPNIRENVKLQRHVRAGTPALYFIDPSSPHVLDMLMQGLFAKTQTSPLEARYWSCAAYLLGEGQAVQYSLAPCSSQRTRVPLRPSANYLRQAMARTLSRGEVTFDFTVQLQTDSYRMPIEDASVRWPESLSPHVPVAKLRLPAQSFDSPAQLAFAGNLSINPWHCIAAHRPLGNQNRARLAIYEQLSRLRQEMNRTPHIEPTGDEVFA
jgi:hypothetical protein